MAAGDLITRDAQVEWAGVLMGAGTSYRIVGAAGWEDMPGLDRGAVLRPARHGAWSGTDYAQERTVTFDLRVVAARPIPSEFAALVTALRAATRVDDGDTDQPLVVQTKGGERLLAFGRVTSRIIPTDQQAGIGRGTAAIQWTCSDPRRYSVDEHTVTVPRPTGGSGLTYPLVYPLDWGAGADSGSRQLVNAGDAASSPVITITGPCSTPAVIATASGQAIELALDLAAGESVVIDCSAGTVLLGASDRLYTLTARSVPPESFTLPGEASTEIAFRAASASGSASCTITWRDAYL